LKKLQAMLEETDYAVATDGVTFPVPTSTAGRGSGKDEMQSSRDSKSSSQQGRRQSEGRGAFDEQPVEFNAKDDDDEEVAKLWTSKDRSKYRKQQRKLLLERERKQRTVQDYQESQRTQHRQQSLSEDDEEDATTDGTEETDDGLGDWHLPNLPVYLSDAESTDIDSEVEGEQGNDTTIRGNNSTPNQKNPIPSEMNTNQLRSSEYWNKPQFVPLQGKDPKQTPPKQQGEGRPYQYNAPLRQFQQQHGSQYQYPSQPVPYNYPYPHPMYQYNDPMSYNSMNAPPPPKQQQQQQQQHHASQYGSWPGGMHGYYQQQPSYYYRQQSQQNSASNDQFLPQPFITQPSFTTKSEKVTNNVPASDQIFVPPEDKSISLAEVGTLLTFDSLQKLFFLFTSIIMLCYCAVSPRTLDVVDYNIKFKENVQLASLVFIVPSTIFLTVFDAKENDINDLVTTFNTSFSVGYCISFLLEIMFTTIIRLGVFMIWEPEIFNLTPTTPLIVLPWTLREHKYRPKRITLFAADFFTTCIAAPIIEEYMKLKALELSVKLPYNFQWRKKGTANAVRSDSNKKRRKRKKKPVREVVIRKEGEADVTNINTYICHMLAASLGMKLCDSVRRVLMYTKKKDEHKGFYAFMRGAFPIHELCGSMTALELAKRDVLGVYVPLWRLLLPAVFIHGMASFRGMKPIFRWNSATPWSEMQLSPWNVADTSTLSQILVKGFQKLIWLSILGRVLGYCIKNYYLLGRQAGKYATTYAGKYAAFSAELAADQMLKKTKKD